MKRIKYLLTLLFVSICAVQSAWAERVAPTMPASVTPESGQTYYVFNTQAELFLSNYNAISVAGADVLINIVDGRGTQFKMGSYFMLSYSDGNMDNTSTTTNSRSYWTIVDAGDGTSFIQCSAYNSSYYNEAEYLGVKSASTVLKHNCSLEDNVHWKFFTIEDGLRYRAELRLYKALNTIEAYGKGWYIENYESLYSDRANQTASDLWAAAIALDKSIGMSTGYQAPWWNERPILFYTADGDFGQSYSYTWTTKDHSTYFERRISKNGQSSISATVLVEEPSTLVYSTNGGLGGVTVFIDGAQVRSLPNSQFNVSPSSKTYARFFEELEPGLHTITWTYQNGDSPGNNDFCLCYVGVMSKPQITVSLLEPGSLGTEVLYNTDHIKNVRRLKVKGAMNSDDWGRIKMMSTLLELDLSEAQFTEIPAKQFYVSSSDTTMNFLHKVVLPEGLKTIGDRAFYESFVEDINLPSTMKRVGELAFYRSHVKELIMPDDMTDFYGGSDDYGRCFSYMHWLKRLVLPKNLTRIPKSTFREGYYITEAVMPEKLQSVGEYAFYNCPRMKATLPEGLKTIERYAFYDCDSLRLPLPETLTSIGEYAFQNNNGFKSLVIPQSVTSIGEYAFANCSKLETVELGVNQYSLAKGVFQACNKLKTVKLNSPTVTTVNSDYYPLSDITTVTLQVPHYLVNSYKLHSYWYNAAAIEPFDYSSINYIPLHGNLTLNHERFGGQPSIQVFMNSYLKINGNDTQQFTDITARTEYNGTNRYFGQILNNCDQITANGQNQVAYRTDAKKWYFISLPFDLDITKITHNEQGVQNAIRYYDGASRATNGKSGNWKNVDRTSIIPAGTGFIYQTNIATWSYFCAADTENKYGTLRNTEFIKTLAVNASETASDKGWNLVGNPYQCFYNNHCLNFTAPITLWNPDKSTYTAYSLTDDDYAIRPNEAFFVQCPNEEYNTIGFPLQGRQLTSVIESQNAARMYGSEIKTRQIVNLTISNGELEDQTRVVLNEKASMAYETSCDASKFMSMDNSVPQIYTLDKDGTQYAINERPLAEGTIALGFYAGQDGDYTISVARCDAKQVFITDNLTGKSTEITNGTYTFSAKTGTDNTRFALGFVANETTGIKDVNKTEISTKTEFYSIDGKFLGTDASSLGAGVYMLRQGKKVNKVIVR